MEAFYDASLTASILVQEVMKELKVNIPPSKCCQNGLDKKIFKKCKQIIEKEYSDREYQELLKLYISSYFVEDSISDDGIVYDDFDENSFEDNYDEYFDESINLAS
jgi:hypothetical protein